jgi:hypothetical protein
MDGHRLPRSCRADCRRSLRASNAISNLEAGEWLRDRGQLQCKFLTRAPRIRVGAGRGRPATRPWWTDSSARLRGRYGPSRDREPPSCAQSRPDRATELPAPPLGCEECLKDRQRLGAPAHVYDLRKDRLLRATPRTSTRPRTFTRSDIRSSARPSPARTGAGATSRKSLPDPAPLNGSRTRTRVARPPDAGADRVARPRFSWDTEDAGSRRSPMLGTSLRTRSRTS